MSSVTGSTYFIIAGTWLFHEHLPASPGKLVLRLAGIALAAVVVIALSRQAPEPASGSDGTDVVGGQLAEARR